MAMHRFGQLEDPVSEVQEDRICSMLVCPTSGGFQTWVLVIAIPHPGLEPRQTWGTRRDLPQGTALAQASAGSARTSKRAASLGPTAQVFDSLIQAAAVPVPQN